MRPQGAVGNGEVGLSEGHGENEPKTARNGTRSHRGWAHGASPSAENNGCRAPPRRKPAFRGEHLAKLHITWIS